MGIRSPHLMMGKAPKWFLPKPYYRESALMGSSPPYIVAHGGVKNQGGDERSCSMGMPVHSWSSSAMWWAVSVSGCRLADSGLMVAKSD
jgi:hypothetical protein